MRALIQAVTKASVSINNTTVGKINKGFVVFVGYHVADTEEVVKKTLNKLIKLRIFNDLAGKSNLSLADVGGNILLISQFTLYANCKKGNRPSFIESANSTLGNTLYKLSIAYLKKEFPDLQTGEFGADMLVDISNDGPCTIILDSDTL